MNLNMDSDQPASGLNRLISPVNRLVRDLAGLDRVKVEPRSALLDVDDVPVDLAGPDPASDHLALSLAAAQLLVADFIASQEEDAERRTKMDNVIARQRESVEQTLESDAAKHFDPRSYVQAVGARLEEKDRLAFLIELFFLDPFAPYTLKYRGKAQQKALQKTADLLGAKSKDIRRISRTSKDAMQSHSKQNWGKVGLVGVGAAVLLGVGGFVVAPLLGAALGAGAGLAGAAATAHGLALLGGGALAAGGAGMAGGMWMVAGAGAALGVIGGGGGMKLFQLGADQARGELVKLQVTFKLTLLQDQADRAKAQAVVTSLAEQAEELKERVEEERGLNDENSRRITDLEATLEAIDETLQWMRAQEDDLE